MSVAFSPDGRRIASADGTTIRLWDVATRTPARRADIRAYRANRPGGVQPRRRPNGHRQAMTRPSGYGMRSPASPLGEPLTGHEFIITGVAFDADGRRIVSRA